MDAIAYDNELFERADYSGKTIKGIEFQSCRFKRCDLSGSLLTYNKFLDCVFEDSNLSMSKLSGSTLSDVLFKNCKILGVIFSECQDFLFSVKFESCILDYSSFMGKKMPKTHFIKCAAKDVNLTRTILSGAVFDDTDLSGAIFNGTDLHAANFVSAFNYVIDPEFNNIKKASFSTHGIAGLLTRHQVKIL